MSLPQFPREPIRSSEKISTDRELWQPNWNCFCCEDTGFINTSLVRQVIPDYEPSTDRLPICLTCTKAEWAMSADQRVSQTLDWRFDAALCRQLDRTNRQWWRETAREWYKQRLGLSGLTEQMNLRQRDRTLQEQQLAEQKHRNAIVETVPKPKNAQPEDEEDDWLGGEDVC